MPTQYIMHFFKLTNRSKRNHKQSKYDTMENPHSTKKKIKKRMCQNDASSFSLYNHRFAIFHRV